MIRVNLTVRYYDSSSKKYSSSRSLETFTSDETFENYIHTKVLQCLRFNLSFKFDDFSHTFTYRDGNALVSSRVETLV